MEFDDHLALYEEEDPDLEDALIMGLGETIYRAMKMFGSRKFEIDVGAAGKILIEAPEEKPFASFDERLDEIIGSARVLANNSSCSYDGIVELLLVIDGWTWNENVFRAPIWMHDHREIPIASAKKIGGLECLSGSSLAIKSGLRPEP